jgi:cytochrome c-type biogenesis protein CcsB
MDSSQLFGVTMIAYIVAAAFYIGLFLFKNARVGVVGMALAMAGVAIQTVATGMRWHESYQMGAGHAPLTNMYESLVFFAWCTTIIYLVMEFRFKTRIMGAFVMPCAAVAMAYASFSDRIDDQISPLIPALQSNWLIAHVVTCFIGYGAFAVAGGLGVMYLLKQSASNEKQPTKNANDRQPLINGLPELKVIDDLTHKTIVFGFMWLSAGIITGAVWANEAWGTYWSWDPKETWSIITWFLYALTLHARFTRGWRGRRIAWLAILGFLAVFFTYFGVNFFLSGLHSYGSA